jgi:hypothetical protein
MTRCKYSVCPRCNQDVLFVMKRRDNGRLYLHCEECEWAWNAPEDIAAIERGFLGLDIDADYARQDEIAQAGWPADAFQCDAG